MSTAGRATYVPAIAKSHKEGGPISQQYSARDLKAHTKLKFRQPGQGIPFPSFFFSTMILISHLIYD